MNVASSEIRAHVVSVHEGTGRSVGPTCGPVWLVEGGWGVCISSRAGEEGALCMTLSENTACGVPVLGLWDPRWVPCGAAQGPCRPARSLGSCPRPPWPVGHRRWGQPRLSCGRRCPRPGGSAGEAGPSWEAPPPRVVGFSSSLGCWGVCSSDLPVSLFFLTFHCFPELIELNV